MRIHLIRTPHTQNVNELPCKNNKLTGLGLSQAEKLEVAGDIVFYSPDIGSVQTTKIAFRNFSKKYKIEKLREFDFGILSGIHLDSLSLDQGKILEQIAYNENYHSGDTDFEFVSRVKDALMTILQITIDEKKEDVIIISPLFTIQVILEYLTSHRAINIQPADIISLKIEDDRYGHPVGKIIQQVKVMN